MKHTIDYEAVKNSYIMHEAPGSGRDSWIIITDVINELAPRLWYPQDEEYFYYVSTIWNMAQEYINSTYATNE